MIDMLECARQRVVMPKLVETWFIGVAPGDRDAPSGDKPQTGGPLGAWRLAAGNYCQAVWSMFSSGST